MKPMKVVTRFAPSPTGLLHVGSARTALFNWLFARHHEGTFALRIEDTDAARSTPQATQAILDDLRWLDIHWDGDVVMQSQRSDRHAMVARSLVDNGRAYRCYCSPQELEVKRTLATQQGRPTGYDRTCRDRDPRCAADAPHVIRLKAPLTGTITVHDGVMGPIHVECEQLDDMVLLRSDGTPTYMLAVVVDDHDMGVTHIIRGDDHLTNAFRQLNLYHALDWLAPAMFHIPLIHSSQGVKLSKRHDAAGLGYYREQGFLPQAMANALVRLGWSHGDDEKISMAQAIEWFDGSHLSKSPARFDLDKVRALNGHYMRAFALTHEGTQWLWHRLQDPLLAGSALQTGEREALVPPAAVAAMMPALTNRCATLVELKDQVRAYTDELLDPPVVLSATDEPLLRACVDIVQEHALHWNAEAVIESLRAWAQTHGASFSSIAKALRLALTGRSVSPGLNDVMQALGPCVTLARLKAVLYQDARPADSQII